MPRLIIFLNLEFGNWKENRIVLKRLIKLNILKRQIFYNLRYFDEKTIFRGKINTQIS